LINMGKKQDFPRRLASVAWLLESALCTLAVRAADYPPPGEEFQQEMLRELRGRQPPSGDAAMRPIVSEQAGVALESHLYRRVPSRAPRLHSMGVE
jgi:hypothetical protein